MQWELIIQGDSHGSADRRIRVAGQTWFAALQAGLQACVGHGTSVTGITCRARSDGGISIHDFISGRGYELLPIDHHSPIPLNVAPVIAAKIARPEPVRDVPEEDIVVQAFERMQEIYSLRTHDDVAGYVLRIAAELLSIEGGAFMLMRPGHNEMYAAACHGPLNAFSPQQTVSLSRGVSGFCIRNGAVVHLQSPAEDARFSRSIDWPFDCLLQNLLCVPVQHEGQSVGIITLFNSHRHDGFSRSDIDALVYMAGAAAEFIVRSLPHRDSVQSRRAGAVS